MKHEAPHESHTVPVASAPHRSWLRRLVWAAVAVTVLLLAAMVAAYGILLRQLDHLGIEVRAIDMQELKLEQAAFDRISLIRQAAGEREGLDFVARQVHLSWDWKGWRPQLRQVRLERLDISRLPAPLQDESNWLANLELAPQHWRLPSWVPQEVAVESFAFVTPCPNGTCQLQGKARLHMSDPDNSTLQLELVRKEQRVAGELRLQASAESVRAIGSLQTAHEPFLQFDSLISLLQGEQLGWSGHLQVDRLPRERWLRDWLAEWAPGPSDQQLMPALDRLKLTAEWDLQPPRNLGDEGWRSIGTGRLQVKAQAPEGTQLPLLGAVSGNAALDVTLQAGAFERYEVAADLRLEQLPKLPASWPAGLDPGAVRLQLNGRGEWQGRQETVAPLTFSAHSEGALSGSARGTLVVQAGDGYRLEFAHAELELASARVELGADMLLYNGTANLKLQGYFAAQDYQLALQPGSWIKATQLAHPFFQVEQPHALSSDLVLTRTERGPELEGSFVITSPHLRQDELKKQGWRWQANVRYGSGALEIRGALRADSGLVLNHSLARAPDKPLRLEWQAPDIFLRAGNPLPATLVRWPELLELSRGRLSAQGHFSTAGSVDDEEADVRVSLRLQDVAGIYDRTIAEGVAGRLVYEKFGDYAVVSTDALVVQQLNQGFQFGPLRLAGSYAADTDDLRHGMVDLDRFEAEVLGGKVWLEPVHFALSDQQIHLPLIIRGIDLAKVLKLYRSNELTGNGTLDGILPLTIAEQGVSVAEGSVRARPPGGVLKYRSERAQQMAESDARMKLIVGVMDNFHYKVLSSDVSYAESGALTLGVQLQGRNPTMAESPPVNLNLNLEENLPMLLASLQMANNVSDKIKKRVSEGLERRARKTSE